ncbi:MAG: DegV family protein [Oscillospiraceae bacterium]|nr:DegV family protein [Oscillospiraceae bacterium]
MSFAVMTDTSGNLPLHLIRDNSLSVIPFSYYIDGKEYNTVKNPDFDAEDFYARIRKGMKVTTSQIPPQQYADFFEPALRDGKDVIFICMSSGISGSCNSARIAAQMMMEAYPGRLVEVIDTRGASLGEGIIALYAAKLQKAGRSTREAIEALRDHVERMFNVFTVDDLMHLRRGGRLSNLSAVVGSVLQIKPLLKGNEEGKIVAFSKVRGRKRSIETLAEYYDKLVVEPEKQIVGIAQAACREDAAKLAELLRRNHPPKEILTVEYEPVTGCHVGPGALALFFESSVGVRSFGN